jgi:hypothetical protein
MKGIFPFLVLGQSHLPMARKGMQHLCGFKVDALSWHTKSQNKCAFVLETGKETVA